MTESLRRFAGVGLVEKQVLDIWEKSDVQNEQSTKFECFTNIHRAELDLFESISEYDLFVGSVARLHNRFEFGRARVNTNYDFRALEMCQYLNIPHISQFPGLITEGYLNGQLLRTLVKAYDEGLNKFNAYCEDIKTATKH